MTNEEPGSGEVQRDWRSVEEAALLALEVGGNVAELRKRFGLDAPSAEHVRTVYTETGNPLPTSEERAQIANAMADALVREHGEPRPRSAKAAKAVSEPPVPEVAFTPELIAAIAADDNGEPRRGLTEERALEIVREWYGDLDAAMLSSMSGHDFEPTFRRVAGELVALVGPRTETARPQTAAKCPRHPDEQHWLGDRYEVCGTCAGEMDREIKQNGVVLSAAHELVESCNGVELPRRIAGAIKRLENALVSVGERVKDERQDATEEPDAPVTPPDGSGSPP